jgi:hypothetical protein
MHQHAVAETTAAQFRSVMAANIEALRVHQTMLDALADATPAGEKLADFPIAVPPVVDVYFPASAWGAVVDPAGRRELNFIPIADCPGGIVDATVEKLRASPLGEARRCATRVADGAKLAESVRWLHQFAQRGGRPMKLPDLWIESAGVRFRLAQFVRLGFGEPLIYLDLEPEESFSAKEIAGALETLGREKGEQAIFWRAYFNAARPQSAR